MKNLFFALALFSSFAASARAEDVAFSIACGENREGGYKAAEVALADDMDSTILLYLGGALMPNEQVDMGNIEGGWILTLHRKGKVARKFEFLESKKTVQEYLVEENGKQKKVGNPLRCIFSES